MLDIQPTQVTALLNEYHERTASESIVYNELHLSTSLSDKSPSLEAKIEILHGLRQERHMMLDRFAPGDRESHNFAAIGENQLKPLWLAGMRAWDAKHTNIRLGPGGNTEYRVIFLDGVPTSPENGGTFPPRHSVTTVKQPGRGRAAFG